MISLTSRGKLRVVPGEPVGSRRGNVSGCKNSLTTGRGSRGGGSPLSSAPTVTGIGPSGTAWRFR